jgi:murein DD-endopeptidase MepM/ murein hydrolase activator NlpD
MKHARHWVLTVALALALIGAVAALVPVARHPVWLARLLWAPAPVSLRVPVDGVPARRIADTWGRPRHGGRTHQGVDIFAPRGTPVRSTTDGVVLRVGTNRLGGNIVAVLGPGRQVHYYAHLSRFGPITPGDLIKAGDLLGYVGDTGNAKGTPFHLHYGVYTSTRGAINPWPLLKDGGMRRVRGAPHGGSG